MLVLSRKNLQSVVIGSDDSSQSVLKVTLLDIRGKIVKLGFEADATVSIRRSEIRSELCGDSTSGCLFSDTSTVQ
jgi:carbon storage regulator CsrA